MTDEDLPVPLPIVWSANVAPTTFSRVAPILVDRGGEPDGVVVRCGDRVAWLDAATGRARWTFDLPAQSGYGGLLLRSGDVIVTDTRPRLGPKALIAITLDGKEAWRATLQGNFPDGGAISAHGRLYALDFLEPMTEDLIAIDPARGGEVLRVPTRLGLVQLAAAPDGLVARRYTVGGEGGRTGSFWIGPQGTGLAPIADGPCHALAADASVDVLVAVHGAGGDRGGTLEARRLSTREPLWSRQVVARCCAIDGVDVLAVDPDPAHEEGVPVLLHARTGVPRWRGAPLAGEALAAHLTIAGPVVYLESSAAQELRRRESGAPIGDCFTNGPPVARRDRLYVHVDDGAICARGDV